MDRAAEEILHVGLEGGLFKQAAALAHFDEDIEVAAGSCVASGDRPEHTHGLDATAHRHLRDFAPPPAQLVERWCWSGRSRIWIRPTTTLELLTSLTELTQRAVLVVSAHAHQDCRQRSRGRAGWRPARTDRCPSGAGGSGTNRCGGCSGRRVRRWRRSRSG